MKTTTMSPLTSVSPIFTEIESRPAHPSAEKYPFGTIALFLTLVVGVALGSAAIDQANAAAREMAAARSSLRNTRQDAGGGCYCAGAPSAYDQGPFAVEQWHQVFPNSPGWALAGIRGR